MPRYRAVWYGKRVVRAATLITAASNEEARAIAEQMDVGQLHFSNVDAAFDRVEDLELRSVEPADGAAGAEERPVSELDRESALAEGEAWRPSLD